MGIRILLVDSHKMMRQALHSLLSIDSEMDVVAEAENGLVAVQLARRLKPDIVVTEISLPELNGIEATRQIKAECPDIQVIALTMHNDRRFIAGALKAGASGYILKDCAFEELAAAIKAVFQGQTYFCNEIKGKIVADYLDRLGKEDTSISTILTMREREILQLIAEGQATRDISLRLKVSVKTIETHRRQIMEKLKVSSVATLTKIAIREGLTSLEIAA